MGRSGSSFTTRLLQRLGMSLGPFELLGAHESNPHGHYEALPFVLLNREIMQQAFGFPDDYNIPQDIIRRFLASDGRLPADVKVADMNISEKHWHWGKDLVRQLVESGPISGFKDPRTVLLWPFWERVFQHFPGLKIVPFVLLRSPHEIAMSYFRRAQAAYSYDLVLETTKIQFRRLKDIVDHWQGPLAQVQFDRAIFARQAEVAVEKCGLRWDATAFAEAYDANCHHNRPIRIVHESQDLFEQLGGAWEQTSEQENLRNLMADASLREKIFLDRTMMTTSLEHENGALKHDIASQQETIRKAANDKAKIQTQLCDVLAQKAASQARLKALEAEKEVWDRYRQSRGWSILVAAWRLREKLIPVNSRREAAARLGYRTVRSFYRAVSSAVRSNATHRDQPAAAPRRAA